jgi:hypothetical protein
MASTTIQIQQTPNRQFQQFQQNLVTSLKPVTSNPISQGVILPKVSLIAGATTVPTTLNRTLQGYLVIRQRAQAAIWDSQDSNSNPSQTLILNSTAAVVVDLMVF